MPFPTPTRSGSHSASAWVPGDPLLWAPVFEIVFESVFEIVYPESVFEIVYPESESYWKTDTPQSSSSSIFFSHHYKKHSTLPTWVSIMEENHQRAAAVPSLWQWLEPFLEAEYYRTCEEHKDIKKSTSNCNFYCINCLGPICEHCKKSQQHQSHAVLQVRLASNACSVAAVELAQWMDTDGVHKFKINNYDIHFLCARSPEGSSKRKAPDKNDSQCYVCRWRLPGGAVGKSRFCSIRCKVRYESSPGHSREAFGIGSGKDTCVVFKSALGEPRITFQRRKLDAAAATKRSPHPVDYSFRTRPRKVTPSRSAEFIIPRERNFFFFPW